ncbi:MAG: D-aminoacyl-tRNA deacylase, partial [Eubacteriales bacterium]
VVQRVKKASVQVENKVVGQISSGLVVLVGIGQEDDQNDLEWMSEKIIGLRIFEDENEKMNMSVQDVSGELLVVSQFTLYGDCRKGKRPSFSCAALADEAKILFDEFVVSLQNKGIKVETGVFQTDMDVEIINTGPVTILLDSKKMF